MRGLFRSLPTSVNLIMRDPVNISLALIPTILALGVYFLLIYIIFNNSDYFGVLITRYLPESDAAGIAGKVLTSLLIIFVFLIMSWTFIIVAGIIAAPFNSMLSARIEKRLISQEPVAGRNQTFQQIMHGLGETFKNEFKKLFFIVFITLVALLLNLFPVMYPLGVFLLALMLAVQFVDYSWSRHDMPFGACIKDMLRNIIPYGTSGFLFLLLITVPIINAVVPALATAYYTVLWLHRQNKIPEVMGPPAEKHLNP